MNKYENIQTPNTNKKNKICKTIIILGYSGTGKTNILQRYTKKRFEDVYIETIGVDYYSKEVESQFGNVVLSIWDTCGSETELKILPSNVYKQTSAFILVCSYDIIESFESLKIWIMHIQNFLNNLNKNGNSMTNNSYLLPVLILINKTDLKKERQFKITDVTSLIDEYTLNIIVYEVSAKENNKIDYVFEKLIGLMSGKLSIANETCVNTTYEDRRHSGVEINTKINRKKSFQLKPDAQGDKEFKKQKSCCN